MAISVQNSRLGMWTRLEPPTPRTPYWTDAEDGSRQHLRTVLIGVETEPAAEIERLHAAALGAVAAAALAAKRAGDGREARRLAAAASRLAGEIVGLWPVEAASST